MSNFDILLSKFTSHQARIGVIGLGYVGLPICVAMSIAGFDVIGFDIDDMKPQSIKKGESYIKHIAHDEIKNALETGRLDATTDMYRLAEVDAILICVPTPVDGYLAPNLSFVESTCKTIAKHIRAGQLVILESTTYPGTTKELVEPIIEVGELRVGQDIYLAFSPEREDPGNISFSTSTIPKVVGADDAKSLELAVSLYDGFISQTVAVSSAATAEAVKITENVFRAVNIALVNELKVIYEAMGINVWEVIEGAKTKPFGYMPFYPGPGLGGHCIPIDPFYLSWKAKEVGVNTRFIELAGQINRAMPSRVVDIAVHALSERAQKSINGANILVLGLAYKKNIDDIRESPAIELMELLLERKANVDYYDPYIPVIGITREHASLAGIKSQEWDVKKYASNYDAILIATDHDGVDYVSLAENCEIIIDTRNACAKAGANLNAVIRA